MLMPGYESRQAAESFAADYDWRAEQQKLERAAKRQQTPEERAQQAFLSEMYKERAQRMDEARARGASRQELIEIMEG